MADKILFSIEIDNTGAIKKIEQTRKAIGEDLPKSTEKASVGMSKLQQSLTMVGAAFGALAVVGIVKLTRELVGMAGSVVQTGARFETMAIQMRSVTGSSEAARVAMKWITEFTANTPYQLEQVSTAFVRLKAMGLDPMDGTMQAIADQTSRMGGSMEVMDGLVLALGKSFAQGKLQGEEFQMLMQRGVPVIEILSDKLGVTGEKLIEMRAKGLLGREAIQLLIEGMGELAGGASADLMDSFTGLWSNLQDHITLAMNELSEGGALDGAKQGIAELIDVLKNLRESGKLDEWGQQLGKIFNALADALRITIENLDIFITAYKAFTATFWSLTSKVATAQALWVKVARMMVISPEARKSMADLEQTLNDLADGSADFAAEASGLAPKIKSIVTSTSDLGPAAASAAESIGDMAEKTESSAKEFDGLHVKTKNFYSLFDTYITRATSNFTSGYVSLEKYMKAAELAGQNMSILGGESEKAAD